MNDENNAESIETGTFETCQIIIKNNGCQIIIKNNGEKNAFPYSRFQ